MKNFLFLFAVFILSLLLKPGIAQDDCDCSMDLPKSQIYIYFENINDTIAGLGSLQSAGGVSTGAPPDFSVSEKGLFDLAKEIDHATHALQNIDGTLNDNNVELINQYLHDSAQEVVVITNGIKQAKAYSDAQGYTTWENRIMKALAAQLSILFPELLHHLPPTVYASVGYSISLWVCSMADAIEYLEPGSHSYQGTQFCQSLSPGMTSIPDQSQLESIIKVPQCFYDCGASILAMLVYGYTYGLVGQPQTVPWCPDGVGPYSSIWDFVPSSFQWVVQIPTSNDGSSK